MTTHKHAHVPAMRARLKRVWAAIDDANRRMFAIRTGAHFVKPQERGHVVAQLADDRRRRG